MSKLKLGFTPFGLWCWGIGFMMCAVAGVLEAVASSRSGKTYARSLMMVGFLVVIIGFMYDFAIFGAWRN